MDKLLELLKDFIESLVPNKPKKVKVKAKRDPNYKNRRGK